MRKKVTMPRWPAWALAAAAIACAVPAFTAPAAADPELERYAARGESGWSLLIHGGRIHFADAGSTRIQVDRPEPRPTFEGRRYQAGSLVVDVAHGPCNDAATGYGYQHRVTVAAGGRTLAGCGGARRADWDA